MIKKFLFFILLFSLIPAISFSDIYQSYDSSGNAVYSDVPTQGAKKVDLSQSGMAPPSSLVPSTAAGINTANAKVIKPTQNGERAITIVSPSNQENIHNVRPLPVQVSVEPELKKDELVQIFLDGAPSGPPVESTQLTVENSDRGLHTLFATLSNKQGQQLAASPTITIYVHYDNLGPLAPKK